MVLTKDGKVLDSFVMSPQALICNESKARLIFYTNILKKGGEIISSWIRDVCLVYHHIHSLEKMSELVSLNVMKNLTCSMHM